MIADFEPGLITDADAGRHEGRQGQGPGPRSPGLPCRFRPRRVAGGGFLCRSLTGTDWDAASG
jgi:hypothetical protein